MDHRRAAAAGAMLAAMGRRSGQSVRTRGGRATRTASPRPILVPLGEQWWSLTPYDGCAHRCVYCSAAAQGVSRPKARRDELSQRLRDELRQVAVRDAITVGALAEAYPPVEATRRLTRACLVELIAQRRSFTIVTKGTTVLRDADLLAPYARRCAVFVSLSTLDEAIARRIEPGAPPAGERLRLVHRLRAAGVKVGVSAAPWIPGVTDTRQLLAQIPRSIPVQFAPLHAVWVRGRVPGLALPQEEINQRYRDEFARTRRRARVSWIAPPEPGSLQLNCLRFLE